MTHTGKYNYAAVMTVIETMVRLAYCRGTTAKELVVEIHKQYCISGGGNMEANDDDKVKETALTVSFDIK